MTSAKCGYTGLHSDLQIIGTWRGVSRLQLRVVEMASDSLYKSVDLLPKEANFVVWSHSGTADWFSRINLASAVLSLPFLSWAQGKYHSPTLPEHPRTKKPIEGKMNGGVNRKFQIENESTDGNDQTHQEKRLLDREISYTGTLSRLDVPWRYVY